RSDDGVLHAAADLADGRREVGEEVQGEAADAGAADEKEDADQRQDRERGREDAQRARGDVDGLAAAIDAHRCFPTRQTRSRAPTLRRSVTAKRSRPISDSAERCRSSAASAYSLATTLAIVCDGANSDAAISARLPITMVTAIVSPSARPRPRMMAP